MTNIEGQVSSKTLKAVLLPGEVATFVARPPEVLTAGRKLDGPLLLLTDRRFLVVREPLFGRSRVEFEVSWADVGDVEGHLASSGMRIELTLPTPRGPVMIRTLTADGSDVESAIRERYIDYR